ncbi:unnamed protein product [Rotaria socialis]|uniref:RNA helicase n=1 Tax=Rotaria socialis TaxID=392032 RepID=A0A818ZT66_9BILA|nr:unnamed protein product [Rotaria socialis]CAF4451188.1 unnamed protein product [Rotaria socialis]
MPSDVEFRRLLIDLDDEMSNDERKRFIFLLGNDIPKRKRDEPLVDIFTILIDRGRISESNCNYLVELLERTKLTALAYKVASYSTKHTPSTSISTVLESSQPTDNTNVSSTGTIDNVPKDTPTLAELVNDINSEDSMILSESEQNTPTDIKPMTVQPDLASMFLYLENIDLKVFENDTWSDDFLKKINVNIHPYEYQRELVQSAIQAGNTIICLRTGGGKTLVAALLLKYYSIKKMALSKTEETKFLGFFIVPRRAMLKQIFEKLKTIGNLRILACDEHYDITKYLKSYDVIICTPQKLLDCLKAKTIFMSDIDLLCYDECHDTVVRNQYIGIMQYIMCRDVDHIPSVNSLPIIIGLTAVVGLHRSSPLHITNHLTVLCATFNCFTITSVLKEDNEAELEQYVCRTSEDEIICITKQKKFDMLRLSIEKELRNLILQLFLSKDTNPLRIFPEKDIDMNGYEQNLEMLKQSEQKKQQFPSVILINYILAIYRHLRSLADLTPDLVLSDLKDYFEMIYKSREHPIAVDTLIYNKCQSLLKTKLTQLEESEQILLNPKLDKLVELLKKHTEKPNSRALILVERTFYAQKICEFLGNHIELKCTIKPCWLVSQNGPDSKKSNKKEDSVLIDFRNGVYNVMISTDVVRASLDIPECSLVLRYDFVPDSIGTVQARVRARRTNCVYYLITTKDSQNYIKELDSRQCEQDLKEVLEIWKQIPSHEFKERVVEKQTSLIKEWSESLTKALATERIVSENTELIGDVLCRACGYHLGKLSRLRQYEQSYFISDHDFYNRIEEKLLPEPKEYVATLITGKALCGSKNCRAKLGCIQMLKHHSSISPIYPLKCESIKIKLFEKENGNETMILKKQWKQMLFKIPPLEISCSKNDEDIYYDAYDVVQTDV